MRKLNFIIIGAHKSGTTTLFQYLRHHPQVFLPPEKEGAFFSNEHWFAQGWERFAQEFFSNARPNQLLGKVTPHYMAYPQVPARVFGLMPEVKLIALLRNPVDRAFSHYRMAVRTHHERRAFEEAVAECLKQGGPIDYLSLGEYGRILGSYLQYFSRSQLLVLFTVDLEAQPGSLVRSLCEYLGIDQDFVPPNLGRRYHAGGMKQRFPWIVPAAKRIRPVWLLWKTLPERQKGAFRFWFHTQFNVRSEKAAELDSKTRLRLVDHYREDVRSLEALIGQRVPWAEFA